MGLACLQQRSVKVLILDLGKEYGARKMRECDIHRVEQGGNGFGF